MATSKVDDTKRIVLPDGRPGDVFDIHHQAEGRYVLVSLEKPEPSGSMSKQDVLNAMESAPLRPAMSWEALRDLTREP